MFEIKEGYLVMEYDLSNEKVEKHRQYFQNNYARPYIPQQGTEIILDMVHTFSHSGPCLDLGGGVNSYFWSIPSPGYSKITNVDIDVEAFIVCNEIKGMMFDGGCFQFALNRYNRSAADVYQQPMEFICANVLDSSLNISSSFETVTQFGLLGLLRTSEMYIKKFNDFFYMVKKGGVFLGANWLYSNQMSEKRGYSNTYLTLELIEQIAEVNHGILLANQLIPIIGDQDYKGVLAYAIKKV